MSTPKLTIEECWDIIRDLNEEAHAATYDEWEEAGDDEELLEDASYNQAIEFREAFQVLDPETQEAILYYEKNNPDHDMVEEFKSWWGEE